MVDTFIACIKAWLLTPARCLVKTIILYDFPEFPEYVSYIFWKWNLITQISIWSCWNSYWFLSGKKCWPKLKHFRLVLEMFKKIYYRKRSGYILCQSSRSEYNSLVSKKINAIACWRGEWDSSFWAERDHQMTSGLCWGNRNVDQFPVSYRIPYLG